MEIFRRLGKIRLSVLVLFIFCNLQASQVSTQIITIHQVSHLGFKSTDELKLIGQDLYYNQKIVKNRRAFELFRKISSANLSRYGSSCESGILVLKNSLARKHPQKGCLHGDQEKVVIGQLQEMRSLALGESHQ